MKRANGTRHYSNGDVVLDAWPGDTWFFAGHVYVYDGVRGWIPYAI